MANEFIIKNGLVVETGGIDVTGSLTLTTAFCNSEMCNASLPKVPLVPFACEYLCKGTSLEG